MRQAARFFLIAVTSLLLMTCTGAGLTLAEAGLVEPDYGHPDSDYLTGTEALTTGLLLTASIWTTAWNLTAKDHAGFQVRGLAGVVAGGLTIAEGASKLGDPDGDQVGWVEVALGGLAMAVGVVNLSGKEEPTGDLLDARVGPWIGSGTGIRVDLTF